MVITSHTRQHRVVITSHTHQHRVVMTSRACAQAELTMKILEYHESGFTEDLKDLFYRRGSKCGDQSDGQLQV